MKKIFSVIFVLLAFMFTIGILSGYANHSAFADQIFDISVSSKSAYLIDANSGTVIYQKNQTERMPIASMCKIMTLLLCFDAVDNNNLKLDDEILVSENASGMGGSQVFLEKNVKYRAGDLLKSIIVASANDACVAMAEHLCGNEADFVFEMNKKARALNMDNTNFTNCTGLPKPGQYSCSKDVATMFKQLLNHDEYFKFSRIWTDKIFHPNDRVTDITNTNKLIRFYEGCDCGKTGYTNEAGHCLVASAKKGNMRLIAVVISAPDSKTRFKEASSMFNYGFDNYTNKIVVDKNIPLDLSVSVENGKKNSLSVSAEKSFYIFSKKNQKRSIEIVFTPSSKIKAPIKIGDVVGELSLYENGIEIGRINVISNEEILSKTYFDLINDLADNWTIL